MQSNKQSGSYECGYYVMQWMLNIVQAAINKGWDQVILQYNKHSKIWVCYSCTNSKIFKCTVFQRPTPARFVSIGVCENNMIKVFCNHV